MAGLDTNFVPETARDITSQQMPNLLSTGKSTTTIALHRDKIFVRKLAHWSGFQGDVSKTMQGIAWSTRILSVRPASSNTPPNFITSEKLRCRDEQSVSGRYNQSALYYSATVAYEQGIPDFFGDYKCSYESLSDNLNILDFVAFNSSTVMHLINTSKSSLGSKT